MAGIGFAEYSRRIGREPTVMPPEELDNTLPFIRCTSCGKVIAAQTQAFKDMILGEMFRTGLPREKINPSFVEQTFNKLGLLRPCCRINVVNPILLPIGGLVTSELDQIRSSISSSYYPSEIPSGGIAARMRDLKLSTEPTTRFVRRVIDLKQEAMEQRRNVGTYTEL